MYSCIALRQSRLLPHLLYRNSRPVGKILSSHWRDHRQQGKSNAHSHHTTSGIQNHLNQITENVSKSQGGTVNMGVNEAPWRIHAWLSPLEPYGRHQDVSGGRPDGVGNQVLQRNGFKRWCESPDGLVDPTILCCGDKGIGKTYISSLVIDTLCEQPRRNGVVVLFFYCDYRTKKAQSAVNIIGCLLRQFVLGAAGIPEGIRKAFDESGQGNRKGLPLPEMVKLFIKTIIPLERAYICIDAVDELLPEERAKFLDALGQISRQAPNMRVFLTAMPKVRGEIEKHFVDGAYSKIVEIDQGDIARDISRKMDDSVGDGDVLADGPINDTMRRKSKKASDISPPTVLETDDFPERTSEKALERRESTYFKLGPLFKTLWGSLPMARKSDDISRETRLAMQKEMLQKVTMNGMDLDSLYGQTLQKIREQKGDLPRLGMKVLMWVSHAKRPLRMDELCHALAVDPEMRGCYAKNIPARDTVLGSCLGLVMAEKRTLKVRLIHDTLQQYLSRPGILHGAHKVLGETCIAFLNYRRVKRLRARKIEDLGHIPFLEYSSTYWGTHSKIELSDRAKTLALELLENFENHIAFKFFLNESLWYYFSHPRHPFTSLHCASYMGIDALVATLIKVKSCDINRRDMKEYTPLMWAVRQGNHGAAKLLLADDGVDPDKPTNSGETPLLWASGRLGDEEMVRVLIQGGADPTKADKKGETPLRVASRNGDKRKVALLQPQPITISNLD